MKHTPKKKKKNYGTSAQAISPKAHPSGFANHTTQHPTTTTYPAAIPTIIIINPSATRYTTACPTSVSQRPRSLSFGSGQDPVAQ